MEKITRHDGMNQSGWLVTLRLEGYGLTQPFYLPVNENYYDERMDRSGMPYTVGAKAFKWDLYGKDLGAEKQIVNSFVMRYATFHDTGRGLYIYSETRGSGKTFLACCLATEVVRKYNVDVKFITAPEYIEAIKNRQPVDYVKNCSLLILDDIGAQSGKQDWVEESIFRLVDHRYRNELPTIYTSNLPLHDHGDRTYSRINSRSLPLKLPEISVRDAQAEKEREAFLDEVLGRNGEQMHMNDLEAVG